MRLFCWTVGFLIVVLEVGDSTYVWLFDSFFNIGARVGELTPLNDGTFLLLSELSLEVFFNLYFLWTGGEITLFLR